MCRFRSNWLCPTRGPAEEEMEVQPLCVSGGSSRPVLNQTLRYHALTINIFCTTKHKSSLSQMDMDTIGQACVSGSLDEIMQHKVVMHKVVSSYRSRHQSGGYGSDTQDPLSAEELPQALMAVCQLRPIQNLIDATTNSTVKDTTCPSPAG